MDNLLSQIYQTPINILPIDFSKDQNNNSPLQISELEQSIKNKTKKRALDKKSTSPKNKVALKEHNVLCKSSSGITIKMCSSCASTNKVVKENENESSSKGATAKKSKENKSESKSQSTVRTKKKKADSNELSVANSAEKDLPAKATKSRKTKTSKSNQINTESSENDTDINKRVTRSKKEKGENSVERLNLTTDAKKEENIKKNQKAATKAETSKNNRKTKKSTSRREKEHSESTEGEMNLIHDDENQVYDQENNQENDPGKNIDVKIRKKSTATRKNEKIKTQGKSDKKPVEPKQKESGNAKKKSTSSKTKKGKEELPEDVQNSSNEYSTLQANNSNEERSINNSKSILTEDSGYQFTSTEDDFNSSAPPEETTKRRNKRIKSKAQRDNDEVIKPTPEESDENMGTGMSSIVHKSGKTQIKPDKSKTKSTKTPSKKDQILVSNYESLNKSSQDVLKDSKINLSKTSKKSDRKAKTDLKMAKALQEMTKHFANIHIGNIEQLNIASPKNELDSSSTTSSSTRTTSECSSSCSCNDESDSSLCNCWECILKDLSDSD